MTVALINKTLDPVGVDNRSKRVLKRRVFKTPGPNYIWSADGHNKLKKFWITLYGFINAWSHKILGIYVHVTNNNPCHIGYYYLQLVKSCGGIPRRTSTDRGTETIHMAGHQINLTAQYNPESTDPTKSHLFTKSTHNQKIECLWSQLMKQYNSELINKLFHAVEHKYYALPENCPGFDSRMSGRHFESTPGQVQSTPGQRGLMTHTFFCVFWVGHRPAPVWVSRLADSIQSHLK